jgi:hypothetical protein
MIVVKSYIRIHQDLKYQIAVNPPLGASIIPLDTPINLAPEQRTGTQLLCVPQQYRGFTVQTTGVS